jgi:hypothetical protein
MILARPFGTDKNRKDNREYHEMEWSYKKVEYPIFMFHFSRISNEKEVGAKIHEIWPDPT